MERFERIPVVFCLLAVLMSLSLSACIETPVTEDDSSQSDPWYEMSGSNSAMSRDGHVAVWTGTKMIVWGGHVDQNIHSAPGAIYEPSTNTWTSITESGAPMPRSWGIAAAWTGSKMLVWGGHTHSFGSVTDGQLYDPVSNTWSDMTTVNAPMGRADGLFVWTGTDLLIWGGVETASAVNTGNRYNAAGDSWSAMTATGAPTARTKSCAVWTGSKMIIWGGVANGGGRLDSGAQYDPVSDSWSQITTTGAPTARAYHSCGWTGSKMIVWGGLDSANASAGTGHLLKNDGAMYDPVSNSWTSISQLNAPEARRHNYHVWTGSEFLVWGGIGENDETIGTGGKYNPVTDTWTATPSGGEPYSRANSYPMSIWTGSGLLVWGGYKTGLGLYGAGFILEP